MTLACPTQAYSDGFKIDHTPGSALIAGDVVNAGKGVIGFSDVAVAADRKSALALRGARKMKKGSGVTFSVGDEVHYDITSKTALALALSMVGDDTLPAGICIEAAASGDDSVVFLPFELVDRYSVLRPYVFEFDFETTAGTGTGVKTLLPAFMNKHGLIFYDAFALVTEVFGGASEDQGIVTLKDTESSPNTLGTITAANAAADAANDVIRCTGDLQTAADGDAAKVIAAGKGITGTITQQTSGSGEAGKMKVYLHLLPLL